MTSQFDLTRFFHSGIPDPENEIHVLFDCYNAWRQDTFKKIKVTDNIELGTGNKLQKLKILVLVGSLKSLIIFGKYIK